MMWWHRGNGGDGIESHMLTLTLDLIMIGEHTSRKYDIPTYYVILHTVTMYQEEEVTVNQFAQL